MYPPSPSTPSNSRSRRSTAASGTHTAAVYTPRAPYVGTQPLPPSPHTPNHPMVYGSAPATMPPTPYIPTTSLPPITPTMSYGLLTPPTTPLRTPRTAHPVMHPYLSTHAIRWDMRAPVPSQIQNIPVNIPATNPAVTSINVHHTLFAIHCVIQNPHGITVQDILKEIYASLHRTMSNGHTAMGMLGNNVYFGGLVPSGSNGSDWQLSMTT